MNLLEAGGDNKVIDVKDIPLQDKIYARLIDKTYEGSRENYGIYKFQKSLNVEDITFKPLSIPAFIGGVLERYLPPYLVRTFQQSVRQDGSVRPSRESMEDTFLPNLIRYFRQELDDGRYLLTDGNQLIQVREQARFIGERLTRGVDRLLPVRQIGETIRTTRGRNVPIRTFQVDRPTDTRIFSIVEDDILRENIDFMYKPNIPLGFFTALPMAIQMGLAIENLKGIEDKPFQGIAPRINHYKVEGDDLFTIRGTHDMSDLVQDVMEGLQDITGGYVTNQLLEKKIDLYEDFIERNKGNGKLIIAGHSLGSLEMSHLVERLTNKGIDVESVGFSYPVMKPHSKVSRVYTFSDDPLHNNDGADNHFVINKRKMTGSRFKNYHSTKNYYLDN
jgi:hypothetical protein